MYQIETTRDVLMIRSGNPILPHDFLLRVVLTRPREVFPFTGFGPTDLGVDRSVESAMRRLLHVVRVGLDGAPSSGPKVSKMTPHNRHRLRMLLGTELRQPALSACWLMVGTKDPAARRRVPLPLLNAIMEAVCWTTCDGELYPGQAFAWRSACVFARNVASSARHLLEHERWPDGRPASDLDHLLDSWSRLLAHLEVAERAHGAPLVLPMGLELARAAGDPVAPGRMEVVLSHLLVDHPSG